MHALITFPPRRLAVSLLAVFALTACGKDEGKTGAAPAAGPAGMPPPEVLVITARATDLARSVELPGRLQAVRTAEVRARVEGIVEKRLYQEGSEVKAGQVLFRIDPRTLAAGVDAAKATLARAEAALVIATQTRDRMQALVGDKAVSKQDLDQAVAQRAQAEADVAAARAALTRAQIDLSHATVTAPISGRIGRALVTEGALVGKGEATHLATIEQMHPIWVNFSQSSAEFLRLRAGARQGGEKATVRMLLDSGHLYSQPGRLIFTDAVVDANTGSVALKAEFPNPNNDLLPGQFVTVRLPVAQVKDAIAVPQRAVQAGPQGQIVMLVGPDGKATPRPVKTAGLAGADWIIGEGLQGGEQVIVDGLQKARPGTPVKAVPLAADKAQGGEK